MKKVISIFLGFFLLLFLAIAGILFVINPNDFKPLLTEEVKKATGLDLIIEGDIHWQFWPNVGLSVEKLRLKNPEGFAEPNMLSIERVDMSVAVMPLLSEDLDIGMINFHGARIFIQTLPDGVSNLDDLLKAPEISSSSTASSSRAASSASEASEVVNAASTVNEEPSQGSLASQTPMQGSYVSKKEDKNKAWDLSLEGVTLTDASITVRDDKSKTLSQISALNLNLGKLETEIWVPVNFDIKGKQNEDAFFAKGSLDVFFEKEVLKSKLRNLALTGTFDSQALQVETLALDLNHFQLAEAGKLEIVVKGKTDAVSFDGKGQMSLLVDETLNLINLGNIDSLTSLFGKGLPKENMEIGFKGDGEFNRLKNTVVLSNIAAHANELTINGLFSVALRDIPGIRFDLKSPKIDLDAFFAQEVSPHEGSPTSPKAPTNISTNTQTPIDTSSDVVNDVASEGARKGDKKTANINAASTEEPPAQKAPLSDVEPDLSALKKLDISGKIAIDTFIASNVELTEVNARVLINKGKINVSQFFAKLYDGTIDLKAVLDARPTPAEYQIYNRVKHVSIQPLMVALIEKGILSGKGSISMDLNGKGLSQKSLRSNLNGAVEINFADGAFEGVNISEMIRKAKATLKGKGDDYVSKSRKTDFSALSATIDFANGVASTNNLNIEAPAIRIHSKGKTNLIKETLDFDLSVSIVGSSKGQGGKDMDELKNMTIPIGVAGTWAAPSYQIDIKALLTKNKHLEIKARKEVKRGLDKLLGESPENDKIKEGVNKLLNRFFN